MIASNMTSSGTSSAPASTMLIASLVPATVKSISLFSRCSNVGLMINSPSTRPHVHLQLDHQMEYQKYDNASDEPIIAAISDEQS